MLLLLTWTYLRDVLARQRHTQQRSCCVMNVGERHTVDRPAGAWLETNLCRQAREIVFKEREQALDLCSGRLWFNEQNLLPSPLFIWLCQAEQNSVGKVSDASVPLCDGAATYLPERGIRCV